MENGNDEEIIVYSLDEDDNASKKNDVVDEVSKKPLIKNIIIGGVSTLLLLIFSLIDKSNGLGLLNRLSSFKSTEMTGPFMRILNKVIVLTVIGLCIFFIISFIVSVILLFIKKPKEKVISKTSECLNTSNMVPIILAIFVFIDALFLSPVKVSGTSMQNSLNNGDLLITSHFYKSINVDDIIIIEKQDNDDFIIKRVVAKEGDRVRVDAVGAVYVNGELIEKSDNYYAAPKMLEEKTLEKGEYFVLGDNRKVSLDSRYYGIFNESQIVGKVVMSLSPLKTEIGKELKK